VLDVIEDEELCERAEALGDRLKARLGLGAMVAVEFNRSRRRARRRLHERGANPGADAGLLLLTCGVHGNVVRFLFPLTIEDAVLEEGLDILAAALQA
jgi:4-aminobutyrate aminotransferase-like enzyme